MKELTHCPRCHMRLVDVNNELLVIGLFCPNRDCPIGDGPFEADPSKTPTSHDPGDEDPAAWD